MFDFLKKWFSSSDNTGKVLELNQVSNASLVPVVTENLGGSATTMKSRAKAGSARSRAQKPLRHL